MQIWPELAAELGKPGVWLQWSARGIRVIVILALAWLFSRIARRLLGRLRTYTILVIDRRHEGSDHRDGKARHHPHLGAEQNCRRSWYG